MLDITHTRRVAGRHPSGILRTHCGEGGVLAQGLRAMGVQSLRAQANFASAHDCREADASPFA